MGGPSARRAAGAARPLFSAARQSVYVCAAAVRLDSARRAKESLRRPAAARGSDSCNGSMGGSMFFTPFGGNGVKGGGKGGKWENCSCIGGSRSGMGGRQAPAKVKNGLKYVKNLLKLC